MQYDVIVIGAGLAGLTAAHDLHRAGKRVVVLEASERVGGRVATDKVDGYLLDRGFQVYLTAYPDAHKYLDYKKLDLKHFGAGAVVLKGGKQYLLADPRRHPTQLLSSLLAPVGSLSDKMKVLWLNQQVENKQVHELFAGPEQTTRQKLQELGFSEKIIERFFRPFFGGIFLERELETSSRMFMFVFKMFSEGWAALPAEGMKEIPKQLARAIPPEVIRLNHRVKFIQKGVVGLENGQELHTDKILLATEACGIVHDYLPQVKDNCQSTTNVYFWADKSPAKGCWIMLNADPNPFVNNLAVLTEVSRKYAPRGKHLISVSCNGALELDKDTIIKQIRQEMKPYFGEKVQHWHYLKSYKIRYALPDQHHVQHHIAASSLRVKEGIYMCGDHLLNGSINGAMRSGAKAAAAILQNLG
ncbi:protoporphyrinogen/coproporphyrinogen oxidase [Cesiribacter andamanensis]|uniref:Putrescine oxidase n=1 Tax=Cesiribacter andamanensis AMV16 TaxID=1279009 RepID=M7NWR6_9BACT|nr:NAD(P)/FAD-dependent oxidoreductase [Cesiribacter andamanensis]EMR02894.1 Putrescine oxidase [Cesiribacter andamanensis AMV16]